MATPAKESPVVAAFFKGGGKTPPPAKGEPDGDEAAGGGDDAGKGMDDPAYNAAYTDYEQNPSKETFWAAVKACMEAY